MDIVRPTHKESDMAGGLPETEMTVQEAAVQCTVSTNEVTFFKHLFLFKFGWQSSDCVKTDGIFVAKIKHVFFLSQNAELSIPRLGEKMALIELPGVQDARRVDRAQVTKGKVWLSCSRNH